MSNKSTNAASRQSSESSGESGSESENSIRSTSPVQRLNVDQNGSRKRRRLSPTGSDSESDNEKVEQPRAAALPSSTISRISRIKAKPTGPSQQPKEDLPAAIIESMKGNENKTFSSCDVDSWLVASLANMAIKNPTGIQQGCIPEILKGRDCIGGSRTGSGKTVAFAVPILQKWARDPVGIFAVVLTPTRFVLFLSISQSITLTCRQRTCLANL